jgi:hypothetical protein
VNGASNVNQGTRCFIRTGDSSSGGDGVGVSQVFGLTLAHAYCLSADAVCVALAKDPFQVSYNVSCTSSTCAQCSTSPTIPSTSCADEQYCVKAAQNVYQGSTCSVRTGNGGSDGDGSGVSQMYGLTLPSTYCVNATNNCVATATDPNGVTHNVSCTTTSCAVCRDLPSLPTSQCAGLQYCVVAAPDVNQGSTCYVRTGSSGSGGDGVGITAMFGLTTLHTYCVNASTNCVAFATDPLDIQHNVSCTTSTCSVCSDVPALPAVSCANAQYCVQAAPNVYVGTRCYVRNGASGSDSDGIGVNQVFGLTLAHTYCIGAAGCIVAAARDPLNVVYNASCTSSACEVCSDMPTLPATSCASTQFCVVGESNVYPDTACYVRTGSSSGTGDGSGVAAMFGLTLSHTYCINASNACVATATDPWNIQHNVSCTTSTCSVCSDTPTLPAASCAGLQQCTNAASNVQGGSPCDSNTGVLSSGGDGFGSSIMFGLSLPTTLCLHPTNSCATTAGDMFGVHHNVTCTTSSCYECTDAPSLPRTSCAPLPQCVPTPAYTTRCDTVTGQTGSTGYSQSVLYGVTFPSLCLSVNTSLLCYTKPSGNAVPFVACSAASCSECDDTLLPPSFSCAIVNATCMPCPMASSSLAACDVASGALTVGGTGVCLGVDGVLMCLGADDCITVDNTTVPQTSYQCNEKRCLLCTVPTTAPTPVPTPLTNAPTPASTTTAPTATTILLGQTLPPLGSNSNAVAVAAMSQSTTHVAAPVVGIVSPSGRALSGGSVSGGGFSTIDIVIVAVVVGLVCLAVTLVVVVVLIRRRHASTKLEPPSYTGAVLLQKDLVTHSHLVDANGALEMSSAVDEQTSVELQRLHAPQKCARDDDVTVACLLIYVCS